ncbi:uncharacterized protein LOC126778894 [Nymphalis io]|uniref:uncharacterized protein LOC126778894 n=1 Tax=Inachis io TaxID=171585 RepID=UPI002166DA1E|nr:uncharacterized protein LOC126778894 [Nymphalis io]
MFCCVVVFYLFGFIVIAGDNSITDPTIIRTQGEWDLENRQPSGIPAPEPTKGPNNIKIVTPPVEENGFAINILWIGLGIGVFIVVVIIQTICIIIYTRRVKVAHRTIEDIIHSKELRRDDSQARYSKTPGKVNKSLESAEASHYESLPELDKINKKPPPPPIETLPRFQHPNPLPELLAVPNFHGIPPRTGPANYFHQTSSMPRSKERLPTPKEFVYGRDVKPPTSRSPMPLPHEVPTVKPSTLPTRSRKNSLNVRPKNVLAATMVPVTGENAELLSKLKRRAAMNETSSSSTFSVSPPIFPKPVSQQTKKIARTPSPKLTRPRYENDSDEEWTIEHLKPLNLYNV